MNGPDNSSYGDSFRETADNDHAAAHTRSTSAEFAGGPPAEPLSRSAYADFMRQGPAAGNDGHETGDSYDADRADQPGEARPEHPPSDPAENAQGMTRAEHADYLRQGQAAGQDDHGFGDKADETGHRQLPGDEPSAEERAQLHEMYQDYLKENGSGWDQGANVVGDKPGRSPGDISDGPPPGEDLPEMDSEKLSRLEKFRKETYDEIDDILDVSEKGGETIKDLFDRPPMGSHTEVPAGHPAIDQPAAPGVDGGHLVVAGLMLGIVGVEAVRAVKNAVEKWRERGHGGDR